jgi:hypothetical protein
MKHELQQQADSAASDDAFDRMLRMHHRNAAANLSPRVQAQLQQRLRALRTPMDDTRRRAPAWGLALACSLALVFTIGIHRRTSNDMPATPVATTGNNDTGELVATLDEAPDLYLWLASDDANRILSE